MINIKLIREQFEAVQDNLKKRNDTLDISNLPALDEKLRTLLAEKESLRQRQNSFSKQIGASKNNPELHQQKLQEMKALSAEYKQKEEAYKQLEEEIRTGMLKIPNMLQEDVPTGKDESENQEIKKVGAPPSFSFTPLPHETVGEKNGWLDLKRAAKITGSRFALFTGKGARLERALINFLLDIQTKENGYTEVSPPFIVNEDSLYGTGQLPKFSEDLFKLEKTGYYLIPTAEVPLTNIHRQEMLSADRLPIQYCAYTPCFRSEAGSYGKDTRGIIRQHQFDKVELVKFVEPEKSNEELEKLLADAELPLQKLGLAYRVIKLCSGDTGFSSSKTYDIEVWFPAQKCYREISSCSNFTDFQARRAQIRYKKTGEKKSTFVHTINGSGLATGRLFAALIENCQQEDGSVKLPDALTPYL